MSVLFIGNNLYGFVVHHDGLEKPIYHDHRSGFHSGFGDERHLSYQHHQEELDVLYAEDSMSHGFERIKNKFLDEIMKLVKEQKDAEDAEYARHKEVSRLIKDVTVHCRNLDCHISTILQLNSFNISVSEIGHYKHPVSRTINYPTCKSSQPKRSVISE